MFYTFSRLTKPPPPLPHPGRTTAEQEPTPRESHRSGIPTLGHPDTRTHPAPIGPCKRVKQQKTARSPALPNNKKAPEKTGAGVSRAEDGRMRHSARGTRRSAERYRTSGRSSRHSACTREEADKRLRLSALGVQQRGGADKRLKLSALGMHQRGAGQAAEALGTRHAPERGRGQAGGCGGPRGIGRRKPGSNGQAPAGD